MATEHRFAVLEEGQRLDRQASESRQNSILVAINELTTTVKRQNSSIGELQKWQQEVKNAASYTKGLVEGGTKLGAKQLAFLAVAAPLIFAGLDFALRHWK